MTIIREIAAAKVNLTLQILGRRPDGYHELKSLVAFAGISDLVEFRPGHPPEITVEGPFASEIQGENLLLKAARTVHSERPDFVTGAFRLVKRLPVAAGLGGGSADAAAALRALMQANGNQSLALDWARLAKSLGADVAVCFRQRASFMTGIGEIVTPAPRMPELSVVLVNPAIALPTEAVYAALNAPSLKTQATGASSGPAVHLATVDQPGEYLNRNPNDLETPALRLAPAIGEVKAALAAQKGCLIARLSGSGSTCFGLFRDQQSAAYAEQSIARHRPVWWVRSSVLR